MLLPPCYLRDRRDNPHDTLPRGFDLNTSPQLQVLPGQSEEPPRCAPCFMRDGVALGNAITGNWSFQPSTCLLSMTEIGIMGPPGPVAFTLTGGLNSEGIPIQPATLHAQLTVGEMAKDKLGVTRWPSGNSPHAQAQFFHCPPCRFHFPRGCDPCSVPLHLYITLPSFLAAANKFLVFGCM